MSYRIGNDVGRFKEIVRNKVKHNLGKYVSSDNLIGQQGNKKVSIPLDYIDLPRFTFSPGNGGTGQGDGEPGDPIDGSGKKGKGNKAGDEKGEHEYLAEFTTEELAKMLGEELSLPDVEEKGKGKVVSTKNNYSGIQRNGAEGLRHFRRTYKEALKRTIASGNYNPSDPKVIPIKDDKRYRSATPITEPHTNVCAIYMMDVSGSMGDEQKHMAKSLVFWIDAWLSLQYKNQVESRFIVHDTDAWEVDKDQFFKIRESGGTMISSAYQYCQHLMETEYSFSEWNVYPFHFSDGDNWSQEDSEATIKLLREKILPNCNMFCYGQTTSSSGSGEFIKTLSGSFSPEYNINLAQINSRDDILAGIKAFLGKGK